MSDVSSSWPWISLAFLGAFHGLNPGMGWLFAVALGLQERRLRAVIAALGPIALGHALAIGVAAVAVGAIGFVVPQRAVLALGGATLLAFAAYKLATRFRHPRWVGMRVGPRELVLWSFVMASAHGAGLMLVPVLVQLRGEGTSSALAHAEQTGHSEHGDRVQPDRSQRREQGVIPAGRVVSQVPQVFGMRQCARSALASELNEDRH